MHFHFKAAKSKGDQRQLFSKEKKERSKVSRGRTELFPHKPLRGVSNKTQIPLETPEPKDSAQWGINMEKGF